MNKSCILYFLFSAFALGSFHPTSAAEIPKGDVKAWKKYQSAGEKAFKARDSLEAEKQFALAAEEAERLPKGEGRLRESLQDLAPLLLSHRKYRDAQAA